MDDTELSSRTQRTRPVTLSSIARTLVRRRFIVVLAWIVIVAAFAPLANRLGDRLVASAAGAKGNSITVTELLKDRFESPFAQTALLAITGGPDPRTPEGERVLNSIAKTIGGVPGVSATTSYANARDPYFIGEEGKGTFLIAGLETKTDSEETIIARLREATSRLATELKPEAPGIHLRWTGEAIINRDFRAASEAAASAGELRALPLTFAVLIIVFGSVAAALLPIAAGAMAIPVALGAAMLVGNVWPLAALVVNVITMIGLALSIDYSLLIMDRFREQTALGRSAHEAAWRSAHIAGRTVLTSGLAVAIGFAALLAVPVDELKSVAIGGLLAAVTAVLLGTTLLPAALSLLGSRIELGRLLPKRAKYTVRQGWLKWARFVVARPMIVLLVAGLPLLAVASQATRMHLGLPSGQWLPKSVESTEAVEDLRQMGRARLVDTILVLLQASSGSRIDDAGNRQALAKLAQSLASEPGIEHVTSPLVSDLVLPALVSRDRQYALFQAIPAHNLEYSGLSRLVRELKRAGAANLTGRSGTQILFGGRPSSEVEYEDAVTGSFAKVIGLVLIGTLATLMIVFRSVLIPLKAVLLNLFSVAAGFGALVLVFQDGYGASLLGLSAGTDAVFPIIPVLVFCAVFGVSMDYEVFLVARIAEARGFHLHEGEAVSEGLAHTGRLITGAAAVMIAVFAAFMLGDLLLMKMLGFALAITVFLDATVVRMAIGPALFTLAGRWNWWPGEQHALSSPARIGVIEPTEPRPLT